MDNTVNFPALVFRYGGSGQWDRSLGAAVEWLSTEPENAAANRAAANALVNLGRHAEAEPHIALALKGNPEDAFVHHLASVAHFNLGRPRAADDSIHRAISINPEDSKHWQHLAWMCRSQGDLKAGLKWATRARELSPRDPNAINLVALCQPKSRDGRENRRDYLLEALELRPNDPNLQNNLGVDYLIDRDYAAAEACFRRALRVSPTSKKFRKNLFLAIKGRDIIYKSLCAPRDLIIRIRNAIRPSGWQRMLILPFAIILWLFAAQYVGAILILWAIFAWPMIRVYEYLTLGDLRKEAGEVGARRGGFMGFRKWSLRTRLGIFGFILAGFWTGLVFAFGAATNGNLTAIFAMAGVAVAVLIMLVGAMIRSGRLTLQMPASTWRRTRRFNKLLSASPPTHPTKNE